MNRSQITLTLAIVACTAADAATPANFAYETVDYAATGNTYLYGLNDVGQFAGGTSAMGGFKGLIYDGDAFEVLNFAFWSPAHSINNHGEVCGILYPWNNGWGGYRAKNGVMYPTPEHATAHENHPYGINDRSEIAGWYMQTVNGGFNAYSTNAGTITPPITTPGSSTYIRGYAISETGVVVGDLLQQSGPGVPRQVFIHDPADDSFTYVSTPDGIMTGYGVNEAGVIVGTMYSPTYGSGSFILDPPYDLDDVRIVAVPGAASTTVRDVNNLGEVVGYWEDAAGRYHGFIGRPIPPCTGDATGDALVNFDDLNAVLSAWGEPGGPADLDDDGDVDFDDLNTVLNHWNDGCA